MTELRAVHTDAPTSYLEGSPERQLLEEAGIRVEGRRCTSEDETIRWVSDADAILNGLVPITRRVLEAAPRLQVVARYGVGVDNVDLEAASACGVVVVHVPDYCLEEVSNHALGLLLAWARQLTRFDAQIRTGEWGYGFVPQMRSVHAQVLGLVGAGRIGRALGRKGLALGMQVLAFDPHVDAATLESEGLRPTPLDELLARSDYVSVHTPLLPETRHLIGAEQLARMKPDAFLINTSRGPVVDTKALVDALRDGRIGGAGLDVFDPEPLPAEHPLRSLPNAILTPHVGSQSPPATERLRRQIGEEVLRALRGELPLHIANPDVRTRARLRGRP